MIVLDFTQYNPLREGGNWEGGYLAYIAARNNWFERELSGKIDQDYITGDRKLWWVVLCLDGAPERVRAGHDQCRIEFSENSFRHTAEEQMNLFYLSPAFSINAVFRDGLVCAYEHNQEDAAIWLIQSVASQCRYLNRLQPAWNWQWQYHLRAAIGETPRGMFRGLYNTNRDEWCRSTLTGGSTIHSLA